MRTFIRLRKGNINLSIKHLLVQCGLNAVSVHQRTISRYLNQFGYKYLQARKKGVLTENDWKRRRVYARKMKKIPEVSPDFYTNHIAYFLDGVSFVHKYNAENVSVLHILKIWKDLEKKHNKLLVPVHYKYSIHSLSTAKRGELKRDIILPFLEDQDGYKRRKVNYNVSNTS